MVQCEFSRMELLDLDMGILTQLIGCKIALRDGKGDSDLLPKTIRRLEKLHQKLDAFLDEDALGQTGK